MKALWCDWIWRSMPLGWFQKAGWGMLSFGAARWRFQSKISQIYPKVGNYSSFHAPFVLIFSAEILDFSMKHSCNLPQKQCCYWRRQNFRVRFEFLWQTWHRFLGYCRLLQKVARFGLFFSYFWSIKLNFWNNDICNM